MKTSLLALAATALLATQVSAEVTASDRANDTLASASVSHDKMATTVSSKSGKPAPTVQPRVANAALGSTFYSR